jgi:hypothetical protein
VPIRLREIDNLSMRSLIACTVLVSAVVFAVPARAQKPDTAALVAQASAYLGELFTKLSNVVAEERYVQQTTSPRKTRTLLSDYLLVRLPGTGELTSFRDVFEVDGKPVRDRDQRLQRLFIESPGTAEQQARRIAEESARHNIWDIGTINSPFMAMAFIQDKYRSRFRLQSPKQEKSVGPDVYAILYQEFVSPTILKGNANRDMPVRGRWWIDASTGRIVKTELLLGANSATFGLSPVDITTTFRYDEELGLTVPAEMEEFYPSTRTGDVRGTATYGRFRSFGVTTEEQVAP